MILERIPDNLSPDISPYLLRYTILFLNERRFLNQLFPMARQSLSASAQPFNPRLTDGAAIQQILPVQPDTKSIEGNLPKSIPASAAKPKASSSTRVKIFIPENAMSYGAIYAGGGPVPPVPSSTPAPPKPEEKPVVQEQPPPPSPAAKPLPTIDDVLPLQVRPYQQRPREPKNPFYDEWSGSTPESIEAFKNDWLFKMASGQLPDTTDTEDYAERADRIIREVQEKERQANLGKELIELAHQLAAEVTKSKFHVCFIFSNTNLVISFENSRQANPFRDCSR